MKKQGIFWLYCRVLNRELWIIYTHFYITALLIRLSSTGSCGWRTTKRDIVCTRSERSLLLRGCPLRTANACTLETVYGVPSGERNTNLTRCIPFAVADSSRAAKHGRFNGGAVGGVWKIMRLRLQNNNETHHRHCRSRPPRRQALEGKLVCNERGIVVRTAGGSPKSSSCF